MADVYREVFYHFVWATKAREEMIVGGTPKALCRYIQTRCGAMGVLVHAVNAMPDPPASGV